MWSQYSTITDTMTEIAVIAIEIYILIGFIYSRRNARRMRDENTAIYEKERLERIRSMNKMEDM